MSASSGITFSFGPPLPPSKATYSVLCIFVEWVMQRIDFFPAASSNSLTVSWESEAPKTNVLLLSTTLANGLVNRLWDRDRLIEMQLAAPCLAPPN
jgi:hypothetical protein